MLASVLATRPRLLIADEPTTALDAITRKQVMDLMVRADAGDRHGGAAHQPRPGHGVAVCEPGGDAAQGQVDRKRHAAMPSCSIQSMSTRGRWSVRCRVVRRIGAAAESDEEPAGADPAISASSIGSGGAFSARQPAARHAVSRREHGDPPRRNAGGGGRIRLRQDNGRPCARAPARDHSRPDSSSTARTAPPSRVSAWRLFAAARRWFFRIRTLRSILACEWGTSSLKDCACRSSLAPSASSVPLRCWRK